VLPVERILIRSSGMNSVYGAIPKEAKNSPLETHDECQTAPQRRYPRTLLARLFLALVALLGVAVSNAAAATYTWGNSGTDWKHAVQLVGGAQARNGRHGPVCQSFLWSAAGVEQLRKRRGNLGHRRPGRDRRD